MFYKNSSIFLIEILGFLIVSSFVTLHDPVLSLLDPLSDSLLDSRLEASIEIPLVVSSFLSDTFIGFTNSNLSDSTTESMTSSFDFGHGVTEPGSDHRRFLVRSAFSSLLLSVVGTCLSKVLFIKGFFHRLEVEDPPGNGEAAVVDDVDGDVELWHVMVTEFEDDSDDAELECGGVE